jgi:hypothetical protein
MGRLRGFAAQGPAPGSLDKVEHHNLSGLDPHMSLSSCMPKEDEHWESGVGQEHRWHIGFRRGRRECQWGHREVATVEHLRRSA